MDGQIFDILRKINAKLADIKEYELTVKIDDICDYIEALEKDNETLSRQNYQVATQTEDEATQEAVRDVLITIDDADWRSDYVNEDGTPRLYYKADDVADTLNEIIKKYKIYY